MGTAGVGRTGSAFPVGACGSQARPSPSDVEVDASEGLARVEMSDSAASLKRGTDGLGQFKREGSVPHR